MALPAFSQTSTNSDSTYFASLTYRNVGPTQGGRVTTVAGVTDKPSTFYMGSTGVYQARLTVDGKVYTETFEVMADPRVQATTISMEALRAQEVLVLSIIDLESSIKQVAAKINEKREELKKLMENKQDADKYKQEDQQLAEIQDKLVTPEGTYMQPMLYFMAHRFVSLVEEISMC